MTTAELLEVIRSGFAAGALVVTAGSPAPAEVTGVPAVILRPDDPWIVVNRRVGSCPEVTWTVQLVGGRFDLASTLDTIAGGYLTARRALIDAGIGEVGPLGEVAPTEVGNVPMLAATFAVRLPYDPGDPDG
jgi:hypothetical protein